MFLTKEQLISIKPKYEEVDIGDNQKARLAELSAKDRDLLEDELIYTDSVTGERRITYKNIRQKAIVLSLVDETGNKLFDGIKEWKALNDLPIKVADILWNAVNRLSNVLTPREVEEEAKNLGTSDQSDDSSTG